MTNTRAEQTATASEEGTTAGDRRGYQTRPFLKIRRGYTDLPACQLPTGSSPCTSLSANSSIMLRSYTSGRPRGRVTKQEMAAVSGVGIGSGPRV
jgi:hypothetical protein